MKDPEDYEPDDEFSIPIEYWDDEEEDDEFLK